MGKMPSEKLDKTLKPLERPNVQTQAEKDLTFLCACVKNCNSMSKPISEELGITIGVARTRLYYIEKRLEKRDKNMDKNDLEEKSE
ncbi:hypothetical protein N7532_005169 [Penicillium argentinense]|uniref:Uncharacterized protein n=1 Tax=Penicillium argentinense TaxID=1131581 RepID=A0A9W9FDF6_9EURO|nr:uncharacterized protein N7532_005169 [Penicillium argentinense]KAJ5098168.1 hypothetical protein N7532_005169 [Penicillium argentinense]